MTDFDIKYVKRYSTDQNEKYVNDTQIIFTHKNKNVAIVICGQYTDDPYDGNYYSGKHFELLINGYEIVSDSFENLGEIIEGLNEYDDIDNELYEKLKYIVNNVKIYPITQFNILKSNELKTN